MIGASNLKKIWESIENKQHTLRLRTSTSENELNYVDAVI